MTALRVVGYYAAMLAITVAFLVAGCLFFPVYVAMEAWRVVMKWRKR